MKQKDFRKRSCMDLWVSWEELLSLSHPILPKDSVVILWRRKFNSIPLH